MTSTTSPTDQATDPAMVAAYDRGRRSQRSQSDWDDALVRFSRKHCAPHSALVMCDLEHAWASGWSDGQEARPLRHSLTCPGPDGLGVRDGHDTCEV